MCICEIVYAVRHNNNSIILILAKMALLKPCRKLFRSQKKAQHYTKYYVRVFNRRINDKKKLLEHFDKESNTSCSYIL